MKMNLTLVFMIQSRKIQLHYHQQMIMIRESMFVNDFEKTRKFLHFVDNNDLTDEGTSIDKLKK